MITWERGVVKKLYSKMKKAQQKGDVRITLVEADIIRPRTSYPNKWADGIRPYGVDLEKVQNLYGRYYADGQTNFLTS